MTGKDVKRQVMGALDAPYDAMGEENAREARATLAPCIVLTPEEAERVRSVVLRKGWSEIKEGEQSEALALLSPDEAGDE